MQRGSWHSLTMQALVNKGGGDAPKRNQIWYWAAEQVTLYTTDNVVSHTFADGKGVITYTGSLTTALNSLRATPITAVQLPAITTIIGTGSFYDCAQLATATFGGNITTIGNSAFSGCTMLALTSLPDGITTIGNYAFYNCSLLALTSLPDGVATVRSNAFNGCISLALTELPENLTNIATGAFRYCALLALTSLPENLTEIKSQVFWGCTSLALTSLPDGITTIGNYAFFNCTILSLTEIPSGVATIGTYAFRNNLGLSELTFLGTPTSIAATAFTGCRNLATIRVPWAEGAVANAPWGATNATIIYNYTPGGNAGFHLTTEVTTLAGDWLPNGSTTAYNGNTYPVYQNGYNYLAMRADGKPHINGNADVSGTSLWRPYVYTQGAEMTASNLSGEWNNPNDDWDATFTFTEL